MNKSGAMSMLRGEVYWYNFAAPDKRRPVLILTRSPAIPSLNSIVVASITTRIRDVPSEVYLTPDGDGVIQECVVNFDNVFTVHKNKLAQWLTALSVERMEEVDEALAYALGINSFF